MICTADNKEMTYLETISGKLLVAYYITWNIVAGTFFQETGRKFIAFIQSYKTF
jgi:hypothetical protein